MTSPARPEGFFRTIQRLISKKIEILDIELDQLRRESQNTTPPEDDQKKGEPDYPTLVRLAEHGQMNKWQTLQMLLLFQSLLFVGWTNLFRGMVVDRAGLKTAVDPDVLTSAWVVEAIILSTIAIVGCLMALVWRLIAPDYTDSSKLYVKKAVKYEERFLKGMQPLTEREKQKDDKAGKWYGNYATSGFILKAVPEALAGFWVLLFILVLGWIVWGWLAGLKSPHAGWMVGASSPIAVSISFGIPKRYCDKNGHQENCSQSTQDENV